MKVTGTGPGSTERTGGASGSRAVGANSEKRSPGRASEIESGVSDKVAISSRARDTARAKELAHSAPEMNNEERIARLKAAIEGGSYHADADKIADKLVDDHLFNSL